MKQLSGLDATFLHLETSAQFGHVSSLSIYTRPDVPDYRPYDAWRTQLQQRLHLLEPLRRRLAEVPLGLDHPYWIEDPAFDLDFHVRHTAVPPPGTDDQLAVLVGRLVSRPLDRRKPLWLSYVIEGLPERRFAVLTIVHHATIDGASGVELMTLMLDERPEGVAGAPEDDRWTPERPPGDLEMLARGALGLARKPARGLLLAAWSAREIGRATRNPVLVRTANDVRRSLRGPLGTVLNLGRRRPEEPDEPPTVPSVRPPRTPFNGPITPHRKLAIRSTSLDVLKQVKSALGVTLNDVVMAACAGGLRTFLDRREALPADPLVALVPVSVRTGEETDRWTNRVSMLSAVLPTDEPDPVRRVRRVHDSMSSSKKIFSALPAERLTDFAEFPPPAVFARAMRLSARLRLGSRLTPGNLVISNVPGPRTPLYAAGARLEHYYPVSTIVEGQGLNITVQSYLDRLDWGLVSCAELLPDVDVLLGDILDEIDTLAAAAGVATSTPATKPTAPAPARPPGASAGASH
ncbi:diacylglycerol O-acyltransferase [Blastococcus colisei]|uniref:Diacylglycerol O-acyltransferase n=1 Tax=Blastococcus colisei TaxID=1564162 RepID=A0A543PFT6_9ACTN|nr:wax ester/triacylglycerol synthase family O-acyltransferase [Blastococcus colisei]TQN42942.1 diacylglycerol O-acyltransferase [Blastococcus colisei]